MKSILISIRPEWTAKILTGHKTIEVRKTAPKCDLPIDVYVYCTKGGMIVEKGYSLGFTEPINGKVVAKFTLRKVEKIDVPYPAYFHEVEDMYKHITEGSLLSLGALHAYLGTDSGYAWHISDLVIFDKPKELDEFDYLNLSGTRYVSNRSINGLPSKKHPPQSWCYVEKNE